MSSSDSSAVEKIREILEETLPWSENSIPIPRFAQLFSSSDSDNNSLQPFNDIHYSSDENKENIYSINVNKDMATMPAITQSSW